MGNIDIEVSNTDQLFVFFYITMGKVINMRNRIYSILFHEFTFFSEKMVHSEFNEIYVVVFHYKSPVCI
jgi:hypothetical protein